MDRRQRISLGTAPWALLVGVLSLGGCSLLANLDGYRFEDKTSGGGGGSPGVGSGASQGQGQVSAGGSVGCIADLLTDSENCGKCGWSCLGAACADGECQIDLLAGFASGGMFGDIALDDERVYWTSDGGILELSKQTPDAGPMKVFEEPTGADFIVVDAASIYFSSFELGGVGRISKSTFEASLLASNESNPGGLALFGGMLYWTIYANSGSVRSIKTESSSDSMPVTVESAQHYPFMVAADASGVYWTFQDASAGGVKKAGAELPIVEKQALPSGLALDEVNAYWINGDASVFMAPKAGGGPITQLGSTEGEIFYGEVAVDETHVYWTGAGRDVCIGKSCAECGDPCGKVYRAKKDGNGVREVFAEGNWGSLFGLAMDATAVYFTTGEDGRLFRKVKPAK